jgi:hypothetical protein
MNVFDNPQTILHKKLIMKKTTLRYGLYATVLLVALSAVDFFIIAKLAGPAVQEIAGYLTMLLSMVFVFIGIRHYRDQVNGGSLSFVQGLKIGLLIIIIPSVCFGLFDILYTEVIHPGWMNEYYVAYAERLKTSTPPDKLDAVLKKMNEEKEMFSNPLIQFLLMSLTVFIIGFIVTIISAITLRRSKMVAAG